VWREIRPRNYREPLGQFGWELLSMWLVPSTDSLVMFRPAYGEWRLYIAGAFQTDTMRGEAFYWPATKSNELSRAGVYAVRYDCSAPTAFLAASALQRFQARNDSAVTRAATLPLRAVRLAEP
jgi:hypothetical protein